MNSRTDALLVSRMLRRRVAAVAVIALSVLGLSHFYPISLQSAAAVTLDYFRSLGDHDHTPGAPLQFYAPLGVAYDKSGRLFASDSVWNEDDPGNRVKVFGQDNEYLYDVVPTSRPFVTPLGMAVDVNGVLVVADGDNHRLVFFDTTATPISEVDERGTYGNYDLGDGGLPSCPTNVPDNECQDVERIPLDVLNYPSGVALKPGTQLRTAGDVAGRMAVADTSNHRIVVYNSQLTPIYQIGGHLLGELDDPLGTMEYPFGVAIDAAGLIYVADTDNSRIQVFKELPATAGTPASPGVPAVAAQPLRAEFVRVFGSQFAPHATDPQKLVFTSSPWDLSRPYGISFDSAGRLLVTDTDNNRIMRIDVTIDLPASTSLPSCKATASSQIEAYCLIRTSDNKRYRALVLGTRGDELEDGAGTEALFKFPQGIAESPVNGTVVVADTNNQVLQLFRSAQLSLNYTGVPAIDPAPHALNEQFEFSVSLINDGAVPVTATVVATANSLGTLTSPGPEVIAPGQPHTFTFKFVPQAPNTALSFTITASGVANVMVGRSVNVGTLTLDAGAVASAIGLSVSATATKSAGGIGDSFKVTVRLTNTGPTTLTNVTSEVIPDLPLLVTPGAQPTVPATLDGLGFVDLTYEYTMAQAGTVSLKAKGSAKYNTQTFTESPAPLLVVISNDAWPPVSTISFPTEPTSGWYDGSVLIGLTAVDVGDNGVASIQYRIVEDNITVPTPGSTVPPFSSVQFSVLRQGATTICYRAIDTRGYEEVERCISIQQDSIQPTMGVPLITSTLPISNGWYRKPATISFGAIEGGSGLASIQPQASVTVGTDGAGQVRKAFAFDKAGNKSPEDATATVHVDQIAPTITCTPRTAANQFGWYTTLNTTVTVDCVGTDSSLSGLAKVTATCGASVGTAPITTSVTAGSVTGPFAAANPGYTTGQFTPAKATCTVSGQGDHTVLGEAKDQAGNTTQATIRIKIDWTPPTVTCDTASGGEIWPPNHKWVLWNTAVQVTDAMVPNLVGSSVAGFKLTAYSSSENINALGSGNTTADLEDMKDWVKNGPLVNPPTTVPPTLVFGVTSGYVRAERSGPLTGRIYRLKYEGQDLAGNATSCISVLTEVPHDQGKKK